MYIKLDSFFIDRIEELTGRKYDKAGNYLKSEEIYSILEDLLDELEKTQDKFTEYIKKVDENYIEKKVDPYEFYGVSESDFVWENQ